MLSKRLKEAIQIIYEHDPDLLVLALGITTDDIIDVFENEICEDTDFVDRMLGEEDEESEED